MQEKIFFYQHEISRVVLDHNIPLDLVLNLDQTPLSYVLPVKYTFCLKGPITVPTEGVNDERQITATFTVSATSFFLPTQFTYLGKTERSLPKYKFPKELRVTYTKNNCSNARISIKVSIHFKRSYFHIYEREKQSLNNRKIIFTYHYGHLQGSRH